MKEFLKEKILRAGFFKEAEASKLEKRAAVQKKQKKKYKVLAASFLLLMAVVIWYKGEARNAGVLSKASSFTVVVDPGHGGFDPGKVGVDGTLEKDINLSISLILRDLLKEKNIEVILTRTEDKAVGQTDGETKKQEDMRARVDRINESKADLAVSIHQNSFTEQSSKGAQVFYHTESEEGAALAKMIQEQLKLSVADGNHRMEKANDSYYILKKTICPIVIVECGFLSNPAEAALLNEKEYQKKIAEGIVNGILLYMEEKEEKSGNPLEEINLWVKREYDFCVHGYRDDTQ